MAVCKNCGKKGLFLKLNSRGLCSECVALVKDIPSSNTIVINMQGVDSGNTNKAIGHDDEIEACKFIVEELVKAGFERTKFNVEHRSKEYTSLFYALEDIVRIKITDNVKWISIPLREEDRYTPEVEALFEEKTLNLRHCKSYFESVDDLHMYIKYLSVLTPIEKNGSSRSLTEKEKQAIEYTYQYMISLGADPNCFYLYVLAHEVELIYKSWHCSVRYKLYKNKQGGRITYRTIANTQNGEVIIEVADIQKFKDALIETIKYVDSDKYVYDMTGYIKYDGCFESIEVE